MFLLARFDYWIRLATISGYLLSELFYVGHFKESESPELLLLALSESGRDFREMDISSGLLAGREQKWELAQWQGSVEIINSPRCSLKLSNDSLTLLITLFQTSYHIFLLRLLSYCVLCVCVCVKDFTVVLRWALIYSTGWPGTYDSPASALKYLCLYT